MIYNIANTTQPLKTCQQIFQASITIDKSYKFQEISTKSFSVLCMPYVVQRRSKIMSKLQLYIIYASPDPTQPLKTHQQNVSANITIDKKL